MNEIKVSNVGPIPELTVKLEGHGVTVLSAANGSGKSVFLDAMQTVAAGKGKIPLRDGQRRGSIHAGGATITIGATTRHTGDFGVVNLEGRFDLSSLVDPQIKDPVAADRHRIKALVSLSGVAASPEMFWPLMGGQEAFEKAVDAESLKTSDLVEMAAKVKRDLERKAREQESHAQHEDGAARGAMEAIEDVDMSISTDAESLQAELENAIAHRNLIQGKIDASREAADAYQQASEALAEWQATQSPSMSVEVLAGRLEAAEARAKEALNSLTLADEALARAQLIHQQALEEKQWADRAFLDVNDQLAQAQQAAKAAEGWATAINTFDPIKAREAGAALPEAEAAVERARAAIEQGAIARRAIEKHREAEQHRIKADNYRQAADWLRNTAGAVDELLSDSIRCERLRVESVDGVARLVTDHPVRGKSIPYHELSEGERWRIAIDLGADQVGEDGLLVIPQIAWESLDAFVRPEVHEHAKARKVYVLTAEATRDAADGRDMQIKPFESAQAV